MDILRVDYQGPERMERFARSLQQSGFVVLQNHPIESDLVARLYDCWEAFFTGQDKQLYENQPEVSQAGYYPMSFAETAKGHAVQDLKEYFHYYPGDDLPPSVAGITEDYYRVALRLASELLGWIDSTCPEEVSARFTEPLPRMTEGARSLLRVLHYPPLRGDEPSSAVRAAAHEDINLLTILPVGSEIGLEVRSREGHWLAVPTQPDALVVNIGDMLQEASGGYFPSTSHRVVNPDGSARSRRRLSAPLFLSPRLDVVLSERYVAGEYLDERLAEIRARPMPRD